MILTNCIQTRVSIVFIGTFSPSLFSPFWLKSNMCISEEDYNTLVSSNSFINTPEISSFNLGSCEFQVTRNKMIFNLKIQPYVLVLDFYKNLFTNLGALSISKYGFNFDTIDNFLDVSHLQRFADALCPKEPWKDYLGVEITGDNRKSGLVAMSVNKVIDESTTYLFKIYKSPLGPLAVSFDVNENHNLKEPKMAFDVIKDIEQNFEISINKMNIFKQQLINNIFSNQND